MRRSEEENRLLDDIELSPPTRRRRSSSYPLARQARRGWISYRLNRPHLLAWIGLAFSVALLLGLVVFPHPTRSIRRFPSIYKEDDYSHDPYDLLLALKSVQPQQHFRDNLRPEHSYITSLQHGNLHSNILTSIHLLYLASLTRRMAILPDLIPSDLPFAPPLRASSLFDLDRFRQDSSVNAVEWPDLKSLSASTREAIGCFSSHHELHREGFGNRRVLELHNVNTSFFPMLAEARRTQVGGIERTNGMDALTYEGLSRWIEDAAEQASAVDETLAAHPALTRPDANLLCIDDTLYVAHRDREATLIDAEDPAWAEVGRHLRFAPYWHRLVDAHLRKAFDIPIGDALPPFIVVEVPRGRAHTAEEYAAAMAVERIRERLPSMPDVRVIVTTESTDVMLLHSLEVARGWTIFAKLPVDVGEESWMRPLLAMVLQSRAVGFVGSRRSAADAMSGLRMTTWGKGTADAVELL